jgi:hypothetical protein
VTTREEELEARIIALERSMVRAEALAVRVLKLEAQLDRVRQWRSGFHAPTGDLAYSLVVLDAILSDERRGRVTS